MSAGLDWNREGRIWPHREASRFLEAGALTWHVQRMGEAGGGEAGKPQLVLLHGTGASVHSWRGLAPLLAEHFDVFAMDLPRHGFTRGHPPEDMSLPRMAASIARLLREAGIAPAALIGHSAGVALALQLTLDEGHDVPVIGLNSALRPFPGPASQIFPAIAKLLFVNPFVPRLFSGMAMFGGEAERFLYRATHSTIDAEGMACYEALLKNPRHTKGALAMMANWDLPTLRTRMSEVRVPTLLIHSSDDAAIPVSWAREASGWIAGARLEVLEGLGHLAHEEAPERCAGLIRAFLEEQLALRSD